MEKRITAALRFETLEPRLLLSAQVLHVDPSHVGGDWAVQIDAATHSVQILDEQQGGAAVVQQYSAPANGSVEIDASQNDHVVVEVASLPATPGAPAPNLDWIELSGQAGDTLAAPGTSDQWAINGQGKGTLDGLQFVGFTRLEDASGSNDTFVWQPNGPVSMAIVGVGSGDSATIEGNGFENIGVTTSGPQSGAVAIDGSTLDFAGLGGISINPIEAEKEVVANVTVTAPAAGDDLVLKTATNNAQQLTFESLKNTSPSITFFKPSESLTVDATGADDTVSVNTLSLSGASLTINAPNVGTVDAGNTVNLGSISTGGGALTVNNGPSGPLFAVFSLDDKIAVNNASTISTRDVNASGAVVGDAGNITLNGTDVDLGTGSKLDASAGGSFTAGDVTLSANYQVIATGFVLDNITNNFVPRAASITLGQNASIDGGTVDLGATAGDQNVNGLVNAEAGGFNFMKPLENFAAFLSLPVSVLGKSSDAEIAIGQDASIDATSDLIVDAQAQSLATGNAIYWFSGGAANTGGLAVVYDETDATANVDIASGAHLVADGNASVVSDATSKAAGIARVSQNTGAFPTNPQNVQFSVAVGLSALTSHVTVAAGAEINSGKNAAVRALGVSGNSQQAETASYGDGLVGIDGSLVFTNNDVKATVDGTVIAKGAAVDPQFTFNPFSAVNTATNTFNLGNVAGVQTGDAFTYSSGLGGAIGGLTDGQVYYAIRIPANSTSIELAATQADALAGKAIQLQPLPTLINTQTKQTYQFSNVDVTNDAIDLGQNWAGGGLVPMVAYIAAPGQQIGGLVSGKTYIVRPVAGNPQEIQLWDAFTLKPVNLDINPTVTTANGQSFDFGINETPDDLIFSSAPGFAKGQALVYHQALGLQIDGLVDGQTYYAIPVPNEDGSPGIDPTLFRLAATQADALASDGYTNVIDISTDDSTYESGDAHTLTPIAKAGVSVEALLTTVDKSIAKSGIGSEPKIRDAISK
ncbi:MAG: LEPR-XLL domain-containing protein, partial [Hyphomicrobiales bacterium]|nr:LEPR-XLL domain-containing protein [Hyphomicrobiales bacterium]